MRLALVLTTLLALLVQPAVGQTNATPACDGDLAVVRISTIKPGGLPAFMAAAAAHKAWYRANGVADNDIVTARVIDRDPATGEQKFSETEVLSFHLRPPAQERTPNRGDAAWNKYVQQYREVSEIKSEHMVCMPKAVR
jgi:hypothetical protein